MTAEGTADVLDSAHAAIGAVARWDVEQIEAAIRKLVDRLDAKSRNVFMALRVAVTGSRVSPPLFESMEILGKRKTLDRIASAAQMLHNG